MSLLVFPGPPGASLASCLYNVSTTSREIRAKPEHTVVSLGNPILYPPALGQIGDLGPVLVWIGTGALGAAGAVGGAVAGRGLRGEGVWVAVMPMHVDGEE